MLPARTMFETRHNSPELLGVDSRALQQIVSVLATWHTQGDAGMQFVLYRWGELVLDAACGCDPFTENIINSDTLFCLLSTTKGLAAIVMLYLRMQEFFDWGDRIEMYWPAFGRGGKASATIEHLMSHRIGIPSVTAPWPKWTDREFMLALVENSEAQWKPGCHYGYHGGIFGIIVDELCRRWTGRSVGDVLSEEIARPIGHSDCYIGLPADQLHRVARLQFLEKAQRSLPDYAGMEHPPLGPDAEYNNPEVLMSCQPSGGGVATARDLAGIFNLVAGEGCYKGKRFWTKEIQVEATRPRNLASVEKPATRSLDGGCWGLGFLVPPTPFVFGTRPPGPRTAGHAGASGSVAYADPDLGISVAFTINGLLGSRHFYRYRVLGDLVQASLR